MTTTQKTAKGLKKECQDLNAVNKIISQNLWPRIDSN